MTPKLIFGVDNNKQIDYGLDFVYIKNSIYKMNLYSQLVQLFTDFDRLFITSFTPIEINQKINQFCAFFNKPQEPAPWYHPNSQFNESKENWLNYHITKLLELKIISKVDKKPDYINSINVIPKGRLFEFIPNFESLNDEKNFSHGYTYLGMPNDIKTRVDYNVYQIFTKLKSKIFSVLSFKYLSYSFDIMDKYRKYTSFIFTFNGIDQYYQFNKLHPNMNVTHIHLQKKLNFIFQDLIDQSIVKIIGEHFLISSITPDDHLVNLKKILTRSNKYDMKISLEESKIFFDEIEFCKFWLDDKGISIPPNIKNDEKIFQPNTQEELNYLKDIIPLYKRLYQIRANDYEINKKNLDGDFNHLRNSSSFNEALNFFKNAFLNSIKINYTSKSLKRSGSNLQQNLSKRQRLNPPEIPQQQQQIPPQQQIPQQQYQQIPPQQQIPQQQYQQIPPQQQIPQQQYQQIPQENQQQQYQQIPQENQQQQHQLTVTQRFQQIYLQDIKEEFEKNSRQDIGQTLEQRYLEQMVQDFLKEYQNPDPPLNEQQIQQRFQQVYLPKITVEFLESILKNNLDLQLNFRQIINEYFQKYLLWKLQQYQQQIQQLNQQQNQQPFQQQYQQPFQQQNQQPFQQQYQQPFQQQIQQSNQQQIQQLNQQQNQQSFQQQYQQPFQQQIQQSNQQQIQQLNQQQNQQPFQQQNQQPFQHPNSGQYPPQNWPQNN